jgi:hypothetical protein
MPGRSSASRVREGAADKAATQLVEVQPRQLSMSNVKRRHIPVRVTGRAMRGVKGLAARQRCRGRSSLEAERVQEPEGDRMTAASIHGSPLKLLCGGFSVRRTRFPWGEAGVLGEGMDECSRGARRGMGPSACTGVAEIMSGRAISQQGLTATCKDPAPKAAAEARGGLWPGAWARMSDEGGVTPSEETVEVFPIGGNALGGQRSPGYSAVKARWRRGDMAGHLIRSNLSPVWTMSRPGPAVECCDEETGKPPTRGVYASQRLSLRDGGQARDLTNGVQGRGQNRTREIRPSGIAEGLQETWPMEVVLRTARAPDFYLDNRTHGIERGTGNQTRHARALRP